MFGKESKKKELIGKLGQIYTQIQREYGISAGDFPNLQKMQQQLEVSMWDAAYLLIHLPLPLIVN